MITIRDAREKTLESLRKISRDTFPNLEVVIVVTEDPLTHDLQSMAHSKWVVLDPQELLQGLSLIKPEVIDPGPDQEQ